MDVHPAVSVSVHRFEHQLQIIPVQADPHLLENLTHLALSQLAVPVQVERLKQVFRLVVCVSL